MQYYSHTAFQEENQDLKMSALLMRNLQNLLTQHPLEHLHCLDGKGEVEVERNTEAISLGKRYSPYKSLQPPETITYYVHCLFPRTPLLNHLCEEVQRTSMACPEKETNLH